MRPAVPRSFPGFVSYGYLWRTTRLTMTRDDPSCTPALYAGLYANGGSDGRRFPAELHAERPDEVAPQVVRRNSGPGRREAEEGRTLVRQASRPVDAS